MADVITNHKDAGIYTTLLYALVQHQSTREDVLRDLVKAAAQDTTKASDLKLFYDEFSFNLDWMSLDITKLHPMGHSVGSYIDSLKIKALSAAVGRTVKTDPNPGPNKDTQSWFSKKNMFFAVVAAGGIWYGYNKWSARQVDQQADQNAAANAA